MNNSEKSIPSKEERNLMDGNLPSKPDIGADKDILNMKFEMINMNSAGKLCECCCANLQSNDGTKDIGSINQQKHPPMLPTINKHTLNCQCLDRITEKLTKNSPNLLNEEGTFTPNVSSSNNNLPEMVEACTCCGPDAEKQSFQQQTNEVKISSKLRYCKCELENIPNQPKTYCCELTSTSSLPIIANQGLDAEKPLLQQPTNEIKINSKQACCKCEAETNSNQPKICCCELTSTSSLPILSNHATLDELQFNKQNETSFKKETKFSFSDKTEDTVAFTNLQSSIVSESPSCPDVDELKNKQECLSCKCSVRPNGDTFLQDSSPIQYKLRECACTDEHGKFTENKTSKTLIDSSVEAKRLCLCEQVAGGMFCVPGSSTSQPGASKNTNQNSNNCKFTCCIGTNTGENDGSTDSGYSTKRSNIPSINLTQSANIESRPTQNTIERDIIRQWNISKSSQCRNFLLNKLQWYRKMGSDVNVYWMNMLPQRTTTLKKLGGLFGGNPNQCSCPMGQCRGNCIKFLAQPQGEMASAGIGSTSHPCSCPAPDLRQNFPQQGCIAIPTCALGSVPASTPPSAQGTDAVPEMPGSAQESIVPGSMSETVTTSSTQENVQQPPTSNCTCSDNATCKPKCQEQKLAARQYAQNMEDANQAPQMAGLPSCGAPQAPAIPNQGPSTFTSQQSRPCALPCQQEPVAINQQMTQNMVQSQCACSKPGFLPAPNDQTRQTQYQNNNNYNLPMQTGMNASQLTDPNNICICPPACMQETGGISSNDKPQNKDLCLCTPDDPNMRTAPTTNGPGIISNAPCSMPTQSPQDAPCAPYAPAAPAYNSTCACYPNTSYQQGPGNGGYNQQQSVGGSMQPPCQTQLNQQQQPNLNFSAGPSAQMNENIPQCKCSGMKCIKSACEMRKRALLGNNSPPSALPSMQPTIPCPLTQPGIQQAPVMASQQQPAVPCPMRATQPGTQQGFAMGSQQQETIPCSMTATQPAAMPGTQQGFAMGSQQQQALPCSMTATQPAAMPGTQQGFAVGSQQQQALPCSMTATQPAAMPGTQQGFAMGSQQQQTIPCPIAATQPGAMPGTQQGFAIGSQQQQTIPCPIATTQPAAMPGSPQGFAMGLQQQQTIPCPMAAPQAGTMQGAQQGFMMNPQMQKGLAVSGNAECLMNEELKSILKPPLKCKCVGPCNVQCDRIKELRKEIMASDANFNSVVGSNANPKDFGTQIDPKLKSNCTCNTIECKRHIKAYHRRMSDAHLTPITTSSLKLLQCLTYCNNATDTATKTELMKFQSKNTHQLYFKFDIVKSIFAPMKPLYLKYKSIMQKELKPFDCSYTLTPNIVCYTVQDSTGKIKKCYCRKKSSDNKCILFHKGCKKTKTYFTECPCVDHLQMNSKHFPNICQPTKSLLELAIHNMQEKCRQKDQILEVMAKELTAQDKFSFLGNIITRLTTGDLHVPDYSLLMLQQEGQDIDICKCVNLERRGHSCFCNVHSRPMQIDLLKKLTESILILKWTCAADPLVMRYEVYINDTLVNIVSSDYNYAVIFEANVNLQTKVSLFAITKDRKRYPKAIALFK